MKVCDKHPDKKSVDTFHMEQDDIRIDLCDQCKFAVMNFISGAAKEIEVKKSLFQKVLGKV